MNITEYKTKLDLLRSDYNEKVKELKKEFVLSNDNREISDHIKDHLGSGIIKKILVDFDENNEPKIEYWCEITFSNWKRKSVKKYRRFYKDELI